MKPRNVLCVSPRRVQPPSIFMWQSIGVTSHPLTLCRWGCAERCLGQCRGRAHRQPRAPRCVSVLLSRCVGMNSKSSLAFSNRAMAYLKVWNGLELYLRACERARVCANEPAVPGQCFPPVRYDVGRFLLFPLALSTLSTILLRAPAGARRYM